MAVPMPAGIVKRKKTQMIGPASRLKMRKNIVQQKADGICIDERRSQISLELPLQPSEHMPGDIFDDLQLTSVKSEVDDNDITIENDVFDCSSYSVTERIIRPTSEQFPASPSNNMNSLSETVSDCRFLSNTIASGFKSSSELKDLTTQLLELNNKNNDLDKKLARLKQNYEAKVSKLQAEKKGNEFKIKNILQLLQNWRDSSDSSSLGLSQISSNEISTGISSLVKDFQQAPSRGASTKNRGKRYVSKNRSSDKECMERPQCSQHSPEPIFCDDDSQSDDDLDYEDSVSLESIDAELVCLSDLYGPKKSRVSDSKTALKKHIKEISEINRAACNLHKNFTKANVIKKMSSLKPVVCLNDIYANKRDIAEGRISMNDVKCGSYVVIKLSSKKTFKHYCAVVRNKTESGDCFALYMEKKKDNEFIFPEKEVVYKIEEGDIVKVLQEPEVKVKGLRVYYTFLDNLDDIESLT